MNLQTSFLTPPFGFALFYLRSVAAKKDYKDRITGETIPAVTTAQIYKGSIAFIVLQIIMVALVISFPKLVTGGINEGVRVNAEEALQNMGVPAATDPAAATPAERAASGAEGQATEADGEKKDDEEEDPMKALEEAMKKDEQKK
jgi:hypothetical protein